MRLADEREARESADALLLQLRNEAKHSAEQIDNLQKQIVAFEQQMEQDSAKLFKQDREIQSQRKLVSDLKERHTSVYRKRDALRKRFERQKKKLLEIKQPLEHPDDTVRRYNLKDAGTIRSEVRVMIRQLACQGVSTERVTEIIRVVGEALGVEVIGSISAHSVARIMLEGLVQAQMQIAQELQQADYVTICGDGTTIKNQQHEAKSVFVKLPVHENNNTSSQPTPLQPTPLVRKLGVHKAPSHTAEQQLDGWKNVIDVCCDRLQRSPLGRGGHFTSSMVAPKLRSVLTDHASDQKRLFQLLNQWKQNVDRNSRAVRKLKTMTVDQQLYALTCYLDNAADSTDNWRALPSEQQAAMMHDAWLALAAQIGEAEFQKLSLDEQLEVDFLAWAGCCMHKELNAVKGGALHMGAAWEELGLKPPIVLLNKYESLGKIKGVNEQLPRGAIKIARLTGAIFNNKDDKKGYQTTVDNFLEHHLGYSSRFADVSNTRYGSYCDAAMMLILHLEKYKQLMGIICLAKSTPGLNNLESNVLNGLEDIPTLTELAVLVLYAQAIGRPYIKHVRSSRLNALTLGPFHKQVKQHCRAVISNPDLLIGAETSAAAGALDGKPWDRPDAIYNILSLIPILPNIRPILVAFFRGALQTWERFTSEFETDGLVAQATEKQRESAWIPATNDISEGALGQCRQMLRHAPTMTDNQRNARTMWSHNNTYDWAKETLTNKDEAYIRKEARQIDGSGENKKLRMEINSVLVERAAAGKIKQEKSTVRRETKRSKLAGVQLIQHATYDELISMKMSDLDLQIDKLREAGDKHVRPKSTLRKKDAKAKEILAGIERRQSLGITVILDPQNDGDLVSESAEPTLPEDMELYHPDDVVF
ncbi:hypothetical protein RSOLAG22IIIB_08779 [Rhizoctonia solani]|uniref:Uncharacterized protein n=1 Tax=Rhizoctonia solani TaxID=456999 RepID=A0A0K6FUN3_9AGAM|nr:hypothetical protein RSOLAG22IIIB_08779 [Rhizoctonia solani]